jgi:hypothetical protein
VQQSRVSVHRTHPALFILNLHAEDILDELMALTDWKKL